LTRELVTRVGEIVDRLQYFARSTQMFAAPEMAITAKCEQV
jgi:hypothetical protein